jgi:3-hydroxybutyryl-CoA dehydratase
MSGIRQRTIDGLGVGDEFVVRRTFTEKDAVDFAEISRDYKPVHFDQRFAAVKGFRDRISHGLLVGSMLSEIGGQIGWLATGMSFRFRRPVYFGDTIECVLTITEIDERNMATADVSYVNQDGAVVVEASLDGVLPGKAEREILRETAVAGKAG